MGNSRRSLIIDGNELIFDFRQIEQATNEESFTRRARSGKYYKQKLYVKKAWTISTNSTDPLVYSTLYDAWDNSPVEMNIEDETGTTNLYSVSVGIPKKVPINSDGAYSLTCEVIEA